MQLCCSFSASEDGSILSFDNVFDSVFVQFAYLVIGQELQHYEVRDMIRQLPQSIPLQVKQLTLSSTAPIDHEGMLIPHQKDKMQYSA